jgi:hypothetical protein
LTQFFSSESGGLMGIDDLGEFKARRHSIGLKKSCTSPVKRTLRN